MVLLESYFKPGLLSIIVKIRFYLFKLHEIIKGLTGRESNINRYRVLAPIAGVLLFVILYIIAAFLYPGGSQFDKTAKGFSWMNNYWCNLLNDKALNGQYNSAKPVAMAAMYIICLTLALFWYLFAGITNFSKYGRVAIRLSGIVCMTIALFIFTRYHDIIINIAGIAGLFALVGTFVGLYKNKWYSLFGLGLFNILLIALNNFLYYSDGFLKYLPVVQKITFFFFLLWICLMDINLYRRVSITTLL